MATVYRTVRAVALSTKHRLLRTVVPSGNVADIGCGTGELLHYLSRHGYSVQGVEPGDRARAAAIRKGIPVAPTIEDLPTGSRFHAVMLWHVLEHVPDLTATLSRIHAHLHQGGYLIIAVPDREAWDAKHYGSLWAAWDVPRHLWHFRRTDVHQLITSSGFNVVATRPMWLDAYYIALLSERYRGRTGVMGWMLALINGTWSNLMALLSKRPTSSSLFIAIRA